MSETEDEEVECEPNPNATSSHAASSLDHTTAEQTWLDLLELDQSIREPEWYDNGQPSLLPKDILHSVADAIGELNPAEVSTMTEALPTVLYKIQEELQAVIAHQQETAAATGSSKKSVAAKAASKNPAEADEEDGDEVTEHPDTRAVTGSNEDPTRPASDMQEEQDDPPADHEANALMQTGLGGHITLDKQREHINDLHEDLQARDTGPAHRRASLLLRQLENEQNSVTLWPEVQAVLVAHMRQDAAHLPQPGPSTEERIWTEKMMHRLLPPLRRTMREPAENRSRSPPPTQAGEPVMVDSQDSAAVQALKQRELEEQDQNDRDVALWEWHRRQQSQQSASSSSDLPPHRDDAAKAQLQDRTALLSRLGLSGGNRQQCARLKLSFGTADHMHYHEFDLSGNQEVTVRMETSLAYKERVYHHKGRRIGEQEAEQLIREEEARLARGFVPEGEFRPVAEQPVVYNLGDNRLRKLYDDWSAGRVSVQDLWKEGGTSLATFFAVVYDLDHDHNQFATSLAELDTLPPEDARRTSPGVEMAYKQWTRGALDDAQIVDLYGQSALDGFRTAKEAEATQLDVMEDTEGTTVPFAGLLPREPELGHDEAAMVQMETATATRMQQDAEREYYLKWKAGWYSDAAVVEQYGQPGLFRFANRRWHERRQQEDAIRAEESAQPGSSSDTAD